MKKLAPYVNMETLKDKSGRIERFLIRTVSYLPKDSSIKQNGEGELADKVLYRPLRIIYNGVSTEFDYFGVDFMVSRKEVGLLERGAKVSVKSDTSGALTDEEGDEEDDGDEGTTIEYEDPDLP